MTFPKDIVNSTFCKILQAHQDKSNPSLTVKRKLLKFTSTFHSMEIKVLQLLKSCICKIKVNCKNDQPVVFKILYDVCKMEFFWNTKGRTSITNQSFVAYKFTCPSWGANYVGKTKRTLYECVEHTWSDQNITVKNHLNQCVEMQYLLNHFISSIVFK